MSRASLRAESREVGRARADRREGYIPAVVYGQDKETLALKLRRSDMERFLNQYSGGLLDLESDAGVDTVMIREVQRHPVRGDVLHVDFYRVSMQDRIQTSVPIQLAGDAEVSRTGAVIQHLLREIDIECLPGDIPEYIVADVSKLAPGDNLTVADLDVPEGIVVNADPDQIVVTVSIPRALRSAARAGAAAQGAGAAQADGDDADDQEAGDQE